MPIASNLDEILTPRDSDRWNLLLPGRKSVFGSVAFLSIAADHTGGEPRLFSCRVGDEVVNYPFLVRRIDALPFAEGTASEASDIASPEYTGPLSDAPPTPETAIAFQSAFAEYCRRENIVSEFAHLHPWKCAGDLLPEDGPVADREIVYVDLTWSEERIWRESFQHSCRKNTRRAEREGVRIFAATEAGHVHEFHRIYTETMKRNDAAQKYYYPVSFFQAIFNRLREHARFVLAEKDGRIIAATLYLHDDQDVFSYLGGADHAYQAVRPTNAIIHDTILWAKRQEKLRLVLGGGYRPGDGISRFKATFSPLRACFSTFRKIRHPEAYTSLCREWRLHYGPTAVLPEGYFPSYRSVPTQSNGSGS